MKKVLIIHGWESSPNEHWYQEEKALLEQMGYEVTIPEMPNTKLPKLDEWLQVVRGFEPDEKSVLIGHSLGAPLILRYLESADKKVGKVFLIAGFAKSLGYSETNEFIEKTFDWNKIRNNAKEFFVLNQINDPWVPLERGQEIADSLGVKLIEVEGNNHFDTMDLDLINKKM